MEFIKRVWPTILRIIIFVFCFSWLVLAVSCELLWEGKTLQFIYYRLFVTSPYTSLLLAMMYLIATTVYDAWKNRTK